MTKKIGRRALLRGAGGVAVGLPMLELMRRPTPVRAEGPSSPPRFLVAYGGISTGADQIADDDLTPTVVGPGYDVRESARPLADFGARDLVTIVSGLKIPWRTGSSVPPGGRDAETVHFRTIWQTLCGTKTMSGRNGPGGPTADQIVADVIAGDTTHRVTPYLVQQECGITLSHRADGDGLRGVDPIHNPRLAYESLFTGFSAGGSSPDPEAAARAQHELRSRRSVLDLVRESTARLSGRLGRDDRRRMEQHLDQIRDLETRLDRIDAGGTGAPAACAVPDEPSPVDQRAIGEAFCRLIATAWACDLSRVGSLAITERKCYLPMSWLDSSMDGDVHSGTHSGGRNRERLRVAIGWFVEQLARLARLLEDTPDGEGSTLLDHAALVLFFEGGWGFDPSAGREISAHSTENMVMLVAGRAGGLSPGRHIVARDRHPATVMRTAMNAVGVDGDRLGEVEGTLPELFG